MSMDWQTLVAVGIVIFTAVVFLIRLARPKKKGGCGKSCGCGVKFNPPDR